MAVIYTINKSGVFAFHLADMYVMIYAQHSTPQHTHPIHKANNSVYACRYDLWHMDDICVRAVCISVDSMALSLCRQSHFIIIIIRYIFSIFQYVGSKESEFRLNFIYVWKLLWLKIFVLSCLAWPRNNRTRNDFSVARIGCFWVILFHTRG